MSLDHNLQLLITQEVFEYCRGFRNSSVNAKDTFSLSMTSLFFLFETEFLCVAPDDLELML